LRILNLVQQQAENSRRRILFGVSNLGQRKVAYWSIDTPISAYALPDAMPLTADCAVRAATMRTRLNPFTADEIRLLLQSGYAGADASLRARGLAANSPAANFKALPEPQG
jgi:NTE family protein